ncbi:MAG: DUF3800 domain-containing protein [Chloroflexota bacterium]
MYLLYFDESGNTGKHGSDFFILTCVSIHEEAWLDAYNKALEFKRELNRLYFHPIGGLKELHTLNFLRNSGNNIRQLRLSENTRVEIITQFCQFISTLDIEVHNHVMLKHKQFFELDKREFKKIIFQEVISHSINGVFGSIGAKGSIERLLLIADAESVARSMRQALVSIKRQDINSAGSRVLSHTIINPFHKDSRDSHFIQFADLIATVTHFYSSYNIELPNPESKIDSFISEEVVMHWLNTLHPILYRENSNSGNEFGIVYYDEKGK